MIYTLCRVCNRAIASPNQVQQLWAHVYNPAVDHDGHRAQPKTPFFGEC